MLLLLHKGLIFFAPTSIHDSPYYALYFTFDYCASFCFETWSEGILLHIFCDLPTVYQIVCVRNLIHPFENVRNCVRNCQKSIKFRPKIFFRELNVREKTSENFRNYFNPPTLQSEQSRRVGSISGTTPPLERHDKGSRTRLDLL